MQWVGLIDFAVAVRKAAAFLAPLAEPFLMTLANSARPLLAMVALLAPAVALADPGESMAPPEETAEQLALKLANPVASLISFPIQGNIDFGLGPTGSGWQSKTNIQPVVPISITQKWNIISRTILPLIIQEGVTAPGADQIGLGSTTQSLFFSPKAPGKSGIIWGAGPVFLIPTATSDATGTSQFGTGATLVALRQSGGLTYGILANHIWSVTGNDKHPEINNTYIQPFISYATKQGTSFTLNSESTYNWTADQWTVPMNLVVSQLLKLGGQRVQVFGGLRYYFDSPSGGPDWGFRYGVTFLWPR